MYYQTVKGVVEDLEAQEIETGDLLFRRAEGINKVIGVFSKSKYSHVALVYDYPIIVHSYWRGVNFWDAYHIEPYDVYQIKGGLGKGEKESLKHVCRDFVEYNIGYDYSQLLAYAYYALFGGRNKFNSPKEFICTEFIYYAFRKIGYMFTSGMGEGDLMFNDIIQAPFIIYKGSVNLGNTNN